MRTEATLLCLTFAMITTGCPLNPVVPNPNPFTADVQLQTGWRWLVAGQPLSASGAFGELFDGDELARLPRCVDTPIDEWNALGNHLAGINNTNLVTKGASLSFESSWLDDAEQTPSFAVSFVRSSTTSNLSARGRYQQVGGEVEVGARLDDVVMIIAQTSHRVALSNSARACIRQNVCQASEGAGGEYVGAGIFGSMIRLNMDRVDVSAAANASIADAVAISFDLSTENVSVNGGVIGVVDGYTVDPEGVLRRYDIEEILTDLTNDNFLTVAQKLRIATQQYGIVAVEAESVSAEDCAQIMGEL